MINNDLREFISEKFPTAVVFDAPSFDNSIIGFTSDGNICYNYDMMITELMHSDSLSFEESVDFIEYNTIRTIPYISNGNPPIIIYSIDDGDY